MNDKDRDKWIKFLNDNQKTILKNQAILIKNNNMFIPQIDQLYKQNDAQDAFDKSVVQRLEAQDKKIGDVLALEQQIKEFTNAVGKLTEASHTHEAVTKPT